MFVALVLSCLHGGAIEEQLPRLRLGDESDGYGGIVIVCRVQGRLPWRFEVAIVLPYCGD